MSEEEGVRKEAAQLEFLAGQRAFERGDYRQSVTAFEQAVTLVGKGSILGGEIQLWLVNAYAAVERLADAIALCQQLTVHPDLETRKQSKRLAYILQAPKLKARADWVTKIPDLQGIEGDSQYMTGKSRLQTSASPRSSAATPLPDPVDPSQVNTQDNRFVWVALAGCLLILGGLWWFS